MTRCPHCNGEIEVECRLTPAEDSPAAIKALQESAEDQSDQLVAHGERIAELERRVDNLDNVEGLASDITD